jgi:hypothetical protein
MCIKAYERRYNEKRYWRNPIFLKYISKTKEESEKEEVQRPLHFRLFFEVCLSFLIF